MVIFSLVAAPFLFSLSPPERCKPLVEPKLLPELKPFLSPELSSFYTTMNGTVLLPFRVTSIIKPALDASQFARISLSLVRHTVAPS